MSEKHIRTAAAKNPEDLGCSPAHTLAFHPHEEMDTTMRPKLSRAVLIGACGVAFALTANAQVPQMINYQGRVTVGGTNFDGTGQFKLALVNGPGNVTFWSNGTAAVSINVTKGLYSVLLGDFTIPNMAVLPATVFTNGNVRLRVWFNDGVHGEQQLSPDQRIAAVGYAVMSATAATVPDGAITSSKIAAGAVGSAQIAAGAVGAEQLDSSALANEQSTNSASSINLISFGAKGNDVTDDSTTLQNALNAARVTGQSIFVPDATFVISNNINIPIGVRIFGNGAFLGAPGSHRPAFRFLGTGALFTVNANAVIEGIYFAGPGANRLGTTGVFFNLGEGQNVLSRCYFDGWDTAVHVFEATGNHITLNRIRNNNVGVLVDGNAAQTLLQGNWISFNNSNQVVIGTPGLLSPTATMIIGGDFATIPGASVLLLNKGIQTTLLNIHAENITTAGITATSGVDLTVMDSQLWGSTCANCYGITFGGQNTLSLKNVQFQVFDARSSSVVRQLDQSGTVIDLDNSVGWTMDVVTNGAWPFTNTLYFTTKPELPIYTVSGKAFVTNGADASFDAATANVLLVNASLSAATNPASFGNIALHSMVLSNTASGIAGGSAASNTIFYVNTSAGGFTATLTTSFFAPTQDRIFGFYKTSVDTNVFILDSGATTRGIGNYGEQVAFTNAGRGLLLFAARGTLGGTKTNYWVPFVDVGSPTPGLTATTNIHMLTALPSTFSTLYFTNGLLKGVSTP